MISCYFEAKAKARGKIKGTPDLCIFTDNKIVFIYGVKKAETYPKKWKLRKPTNDATKEQLEFLAKVNDYQYAYGWLHLGCDEILRILKGSF